MIRWVYTIYKFSYQNGLLIEFSEKQKLMIDSKNIKIPPKMNAIVTHAHSDHFAVMNSISPTYATQETIDLFYTQKQGSSRNENLIPTKFNEEIKFAENNIDGKISLIPSGHVLGSSSVVVDKNGHRLLFSGDIGGKGQLTITTPLEKIKAEILVVEATFGSPQISFPSREDISMEILKWTADVVKQKKNVLFSAGKMGSAQELIKIFNNLTTLRVVTHGEVSQISNVYKKYGVNLEYFDSKSDEGREILKDGEAVIIQPRGKKIVPYFLTEYVECKTAIVTGMASRFTYRNYDASFPLSSHANFHEIIEYISDVSPEMVFTIYGLEKKLAEAITKELEIPAIPLKFKDKAINKIDSTIPNPPLEEKIERRLPKKINNNIKTNKKEFTLDDFFTDQ
ncbi:MAG TPA: MBL fold metallo-hydrolase [candidate division Zixibacteria bacterium]|nr:MBL fold metallo-hydrolase [candidate division Zixibacteria bacterium]